MEQIGAAQNGDYDLTSQVNVFDANPVDAANVRLVQAVIAIGDGSKDLDASGGDFSLYLRVGGAPFHPYPQTVTFAAEAKATQYTVQFVVAAGQRVEIDLASPNPADSDVDVTVRLFDVSAPQIPAGARTVTITVVDSEASPIEDATVRMTKGAQSDAKATGPTGVAVFALDDGDWSIAITAVGYIGYAGTVTVSGDTTPPDYELTAISVTPAGAPNLSTGVIRLLDQLGQPEVGQAISVKMTAGPGVDGIAYDTTTYQVFSEFDGVAQFPGLVRGATYQIWRGVGQSLCPPSSDNTFTVPDADSFSIPEVLGKP